MFTGIIETIGKIVALKRDSGNLNITISSPISHKLKIDQSLAHQGVCLTVIEVKGNKHVVTAIDETLRKTNLGLLAEGDEVNLERCLKIGDRLDGHLVQGHVDEVAECIGIEKNVGSRILQFKYAPAIDKLVVEKGSIGIDGISLTAFEAENETFKVAIIPYTLDHTTTKHIRKGTMVNLEFAVIGKYVAGLLKFRT